MTNALQCVYVIEIIEERTSRILCASCFYDDDDEKKTTFSIFLPCRFCSNLMLTLPSSRLGQHIFMENVKMTFI